MIDLTVTSEMNDSKHHIAAIEMKCFKESVLHKADIHGVSKTDIREIGRAEKKR
jgi:hypothetical protein